MRFKLLFSLAVLLFTNGLVYSVPKEGSFSINQKGVKLFKTVKKATVSWDTEDSQTVGNHIHLWKPQSGSIIIIEDFNGSGQGTSTRTVNIDATTASAGSIEITFSSPGHYTIIPKMKYKCGDLKTGFLESDEPSVHPVSWELTLVDVKFDNDSTGGELVQGAVFSLPLGAIIQPSNRTITWALEPTPGTGDAGNNFTQLLNSNGGGRKIKLITPYPSEWQNDTSVNVTIKDSELEDSKVSITISLKKFRRHSKTSPGGGSIDITFIQAAPDVGYSLTSTSGTPAGFTVSTPPTSLAQIGTTPVNTRDTGKLAIIYHSTLPEKGDGTFSLSGQVNFKDGILKVGGTQLPNNSNLATFAIGAGHSAGVDGEIVTLTNNTVGLASLLYSGSITLGITENGELVNTTNTALSVITPILNATPLNGASSNNASGAKDVTLSGDHVAGGKIEKSYPVAVAVSVYLDQQIEANYNIAADASLTAYIKSAPQISFTPTQPPNQ